MATISASKFNLSRVQNALFTIEGEKEMSYFLTTFNLPGMSIGTMPFANPFKAHNDPGNTLTYDELSVTCLISENFDNWKASVDWLKTATDGVTFSTATSGRMTKKAGSIVLLTNNGNKFGDIIINNMFPTTIGSVSFDIQSVEPTPLTFDMTLQYESYKIDFDANAEI